MLKQRLMGVVAISEMVCRISVPRPCDTPLQLSPHRAHSNKIPSAFMNSKGEGWIGNAADKWCSRLGDVLGCVGLAG